MTLRADLTPKVWTDAELESLADDGYNHEVVNGRLVVSPKNNPEHGEICTRLLIALGTYVKAQQLGAVWESSTGFWMSNGNCRAPDVSFISRARLKAFKFSDRKFFRGAPDLAIEVLAPHNKTSEMAERLHDYFTSGTQLAWVIDPDQQSVDVYYAPDRMKHLNVDAELHGEQIVPGFQLPIRQLFEQEDWNKS